jgi:hypothetical protein
MKIKIKLLESNRLNEVTKLSVVARRLENPEAMKSILNDPSQVMDYTLKDNEGKVLTINSLSDLIEQIIKNNLMPKKYIDLLNRIKKGELSGLTKAVSRGEAIEIFLQKNELIRNFLNLFIPHSRMTANPKKVDKVVKDAPKASRQKTFDLAR